MIKATITDTEHRTRYLLGLSAENLKRLQAGQPINIDLKAMGGNDAIMIFFGESEITMIDSLMKYIGPNTVIVGTPPC